MLQTRSQLFEVLDETELASTGVVWPCDNDFGTLDDIPVKHSRSENASSQVIHLEWGSWVAKNEQSVTPRLDNHESKTNKENVLMPFLSATTPNGLRVTILSTIDLVDMLLQSGYKFVLTGKFNQD